MCPDIHTRKYRVHVNTQNDISPCSIVFVDFGSSNFPFDLKNLWVCSNVFFYLFLLLFLRLINFFVDFACSYCFFLLSFLTIFSVDVSVCVCASGIFFFCLVWIFIILFVLILEIFRWKSTLMGIKFAMATKVLYLSSCYLFRRISFAYSLNQ